MGQDTNCTLHSGKFEEGNPSLDVSRETSDCARLGQAAGLKAAAGGMCGGMCGGGGGTESTAATLRRRRWGRKLSFMHS